MSSPEYQKEWRKRNANRVRAYNNDWHKKNPDKYFFWGLRAAARKKKIPFDIVFEDIKYPSNCPVLGIPLFRNTGKHGPCANSPSIDKIIPGLGYIKGNVQVISQRANVMKNDASPEELLRFAEWILKTYQR